MGAIREEHEAERIMEKTTKINEQGPAGEVTPQVLCRFRKLLRGRNNRIEHQHFQWIVRGSLWLHTNHPRGGGGGEQARGKRAFQSEKKKGKKEVGKPTNRIKRL